MKNKINNDNTTLESEIINIKVTDKEQLISNFSYDENDKINKDLSEFIVAKSKRVHISKDIKLNFYTNEHIDKNEIQSTIKNHFHEEYLESKSELKRLNIFIITMLILGVLTFAILVALYNRNFSNFYFEMILEIAAWVFIWESVDATFLQRPKIRRKNIQMQKLSSAQVEVVNNKNSKEIKNVKKIGDKQT